MSILKISSQNYSESEKIAEEFTDILREHFNGYTLTSPETDDSWNTFIIISDWSVYDVQPTINSLMSQHDCNCLIECKH